MELWMDLLFGNPVGLMSVATVLATFLIVVYIIGMFISKSGKH